MVKRSGEFENGCIPKRCHVRHTSHFGQSRIGHTGGDLTSDVLVGTVFILEKLQSDVQ